MNIKDIFTIKYGNWEVLYKIKGNWQKLKGKAYCWYADPMLFEYRGNIYLFTEEYNKLTSCGYIAVSMLENGSFSSPKTIIRNNYHMSYPCTFVWKDKVYMIPETSQNKTLELYSPKDQIINKWEKICVIEEDCCLVDTTVFIFNDQVYLLGYEEQITQYVTHVYLFDMDSFQVNEIATIQSNENLSRPAGKIIMDKKRFYKPCQKNDKFYGESIRMMEIHPHQSDWAGTLVDTVDITRLQQQSREFKGYSRTHTVGYLQEITVVDALKFRNEAMTPIIAIIRKMRNGYYKYLKH